MLSSIKPYMSGDWRLPDIVVAVAVLSFAWMLSDLWGKVINQGLSLLFPNRESNLSLHFLLALLLTVGFALFLKWRKSEKIVAEM